MRLLNSEIQSILEILTNYSPESEIYLHGSRIDDNAKGGDIDLFYIIPVSDFQEIISKKHYILSELSLRLSEQKVDLTCVNDAEKYFDSFFNNSQKIKLDKTNIMNA